MQSAELRNELSFTPPLPWVVVDWGVIRGLAGNSGLPGAFTAVIPDRVFVEALDSDKPREFLQKLVKFIQHPDSRGRILIGRYWNDLVDEERFPAVGRLGSRAAIHAQYSNLIRSEQENPGRHFSIDRLPNIAEFHDGKSNFIKTAHRFLEWMREHRKAELREILRAGLDGMEQAIQQPGPAMWHLATSVSQRYKKRAWQRELSHFPDRSAVGRWLRLGIWYAVKHAVACEMSDKRLGNDYDDAHYVFLSLYTRHIWTVDRGMVKACRAVSAGRVKTHLVGDRIQIHGF